MSTTNFAGQVASVVELASDTHFTLNAEKLIGFVEQVIEAITEEFHMLGKKTVVTGEKALDILTRVYLNSKGEFSSVVNFPTDRSALMSIYDTAYSLMTEVTFRSEAADIVDRIKKDESFAYNFFYAKNYEKGRNIVPLRAGILNEIRTIYKVKLNPDDFSTNLYEHLFSDGSWKVLDSYNYRSSFFNWLSTVAANSTIEYLKKNRFIDSVPARTPSNTRLILDQMAPDYCYFVINDHMKVGPLRDFLCAVYVECLDKFAVMEHFNMDESTYRLTLRTAENSLKKILLNTDHKYGDVLVDSNARNVQVSSDFLSIIGLTKESDVSDSPLRQVLGVDPDDLEFETKVIEFLYNFSDKLKWSPEDTYVWQSRYIKNMTSESVSLNLIGRSSGWVDTRFHRLNQRFQTAIREWWAMIDR